MHDRCDQLPLIPPMVHPQRDLDDVGAVVREGLVSKSSTVRVGRWVERAADDVDIVVTVGGISAGDRDFFPGILDAMDAKTRIAGAAIQPGKPVRIQRLPSGVMIVSLPGNPVSVLATACLFLWPLIRTMLGCTSPMPWRPVELASDVHANAGRELFRPASVQPAGSVVVPVWQGSGDLSHAASTDGLVAIPRRTGPVSTGTTVRFLPWP